LGVPHSLLLLLNHLATHCLQVAQLRTPFLLVMGHLLLDQYLISDPVSIFQVDFFRSSQQQILELKTGSLERLTGAGSEFGEGIGILWKVIEGNHRLIIIIKFSEHE